MATQKIVFPEELRQRLKAFITTRSGLYFKDHDLGGLEEVISQRMRSRGFDTPLGYYAYLTASENREDELRELLNRLTINHTYFFRNEHQFRALREKVLPEIIERKMLCFRRQGIGNRDQVQEKPTLRIWSAGCSTGEEAYTIAMIVREIIADPDNWEIQILSTDASTEALEKARSGIYGKNAVKSVSDDLLEKYFTIREDSKRHTVYEIRNTIKEMVTFGFHNLIEDTYPAGFDIIFCRNVVIYFELETTMGIMKRFYEGLVDSGYLFIGYSESLFYMQDKFKMVHWEEAIYYRKTAPGEVPVFAPAAAGMPEKERSLDEIIEELSRAEMLATIEAEASRIKPPSKKVEDILVQATKSFHLKEYNKALALIEEAIGINKSTVDPYYLAAQVYVNQGKFDDAKKRLATALKVNSLFAPAHYLKGCILIEEEKYGDAKDSLRKALYIDKDFSLAHFYMAHAYRSEGRHDEAIREYRNTLKLLSKVSSGDILPYGGGFDAASLVGVCRDNIERLKLEI